MHLVQAENQDRSSQHEPVIQRRSQQSMNLARQRTSTMKWTMTVEVHGSQCRSRQGTLLTASLINLVKIKFL